MLQPFLSRKNIILTYLTAAIVQRNNIKHYRLLIASKLSDERAQQKRVCVMIYPHFFRLFKCKLLIVKPVTFQNQITHTLTRKHTHVKTSQGAVPERSFSDPESLHYGRINTPKPWRRTVRAHKTATKTGPRRVHEGKRKFKPDVWRPMAERTSGDIISNQPARNT